VMRRCLAGRVVLLPLLSQAQDQFIICFKRSLSHCHVDLQSRHELAEG
jgi:hypothetical protein